MKGCAPAADPFERTWYSGVVGEDQVCTKGTQGSRGGTRGGQGGARGVQGVPGGGLGGSLGGPRGGEGGAKGGARGGLGAPQGPRPTLTNRDYSGAAQKEYVVECRVMCIDVA